MEEEELLESEDVMLTLGANFCTKATLTTTHLDKKCSSAAVKFAQKTML